MQATTRLTEQQLKEIITAHYKAKNITVKSVRVGRETYGGDPRECPYGYVDLTLEIPEP
jgi:hypothetical protein